MGRLDGKVALITGAARGQGRAHAVAMAREGAQIVALDLCQQIPLVPYEMSTPADLDETLRLVEQLDQRCLAIEADARDAAQMQSVVDRALEEFGRIDIGVINHGISVPHSWEQAEVADDVFDETLVVNIGSVWRAMRVLVPPMKEQGGGSIIVTSSAAGLIAFYGFPGYVASKHGVVGLVKAMAAELAPHWIRVNTIAPTNVATPMLHNQFIQEMFGGKGATVDVMRFPAESTNLLPIPWVDSDDIAHAAVYLASDEARYVTGITLPVDAGMTIQPPGVPPIASKRIAELS
jgi:(+)-trans-carveol dehydrogenase